MSELERHAKSFGMTTLELCNYSYERMNKRKCLDGTTRLDRQRSIEDAFYLPRYVEWFLEEKKLIKKGNGHAH